MNSRWVISSRDTFDRESPTVHEIEGFGIVPGLIELWACFLFETVRLSHHVDHGGVSTLKARRGFIDFWIRFDDGPAESVDGDFECAGRIRHWVFGDVRSTLRTALDEADEYVLLVIASIHSRIRAKPEAAATVLACARDTDRDAFFARLRAL